MEERKQSSFRSYSPPNSFEQRKRGLREAETVVKSRQRRVRSPRGGWTSRSRHENTLEWSGGPPTAASAMANVCLPGWSDWRRAGTHQWSGGPGSRRYGGAGHGAEEACSPGLGKGNRSLAARFNFGSDLSGDGRLL